jgi:large subunit ribosomal protein L28
MTTTMKALRCIRKVNGLDNYILMTKPKQLDSVYGEYLRRIMLKKLNDPGF